MIDIEDYVLLSNNERYGSRNTCKKRRFNLPNFCSWKDDIKTEIKSLPGVYQISLNLLHEEIKEAYDLGIRAIMFFGVPNDKDDVGSGAYDHNGVVQEATRIAKKCIVTY